MKELTLRWESHEWIIYQLKQRRELERIFVNRYLALQYLHSIKLISENKYQIEYSNFPSHEITISSNNHDDKVATILYKLAKYINKLHVNLDILFSINDEGQVLCGHEVIFNGTKQACWAYIVKNGLLDKDTLFDRYYK